jgi:hypothetical protein
MGLRTLFGLLGKQGEAMTDAASAALAARNPELAIQVDRDELERNLRIIATELSNAETKLKAEAADVTTLQTQLNQKYAAADILAADPTKEVALDVLTKEIDKDEKRMLKEKIERDSAQKIVTEMKAAKDQVLDALKKFDDKAGEALMELQTAQADQKAAQTTRRAEEIISSAVKTSGLDTSLSALHKKASDLKAAADVDRTMVGLHTPESEKNADVQAAMAAAAVGAGLNETAVERLARLKAKRS